MPEYDKWSRWLLETRFGGDEKIAELGLRLLRQLRDTLLEKAALKDEQVLLDSRCRRRIDCIWRVGKARS